MSEYDSEYECPTCQRETYGFDKTYECESCRRGWKRYNCINCNDYVDEANDHIYVANNTKHNNCKYCGENLCYKCTSCKDCYLENRTIEEEVEDAKKELKRAKLSLELAIIKLRLKNDHSAYDEAASSKNTSYKYFEKEQFQCGSCKKDVEPLETGYRLCANKNICFAKVCGRDGCRICYKCSE